MKKSAAVLFILLLVLAGCLIAGCSSSQPANTPAPSEKGGMSSAQENAAVTGGGTGAVTGKMSMSDAIRYISSEWQGPENSPPISGDQGKYFRYVNGANLDEQGNSKSWIIVVEMAGKTYMVTVTEKGTTTADAPPIATWTKIDTGAIISPGQLFEKNHAVIFNVSQAGAGVSRDITLEDGNYIVSLTGSSGKQILVFNATTGALTS